MAPGASTGAIVERMNAQVDPRPARIGAAPERLTCTGPVTVLGHFDLFR